MRYTKTPGNIRLTDYSLARPLLYGVVGGLGVIALFSLLATANAFGWQALGYIAAICALGLLTADLLALPRVVTKIDRDAGTIEVFSRDGGRTSVIRVGLAQITSVEVRSHGYGDREASWRLELIDENSVSVPITLLTGSKLQDLEAVAVRLRADLGLPKR